MEHQQLASKPGTHWPEGGPTWGSVSVSMVCDILSFIWMALSWPFLLSKSALEPWHLPLILLPRTPRWLQTLHRVGSSSLHVRADRGPTEAFLEVYSLHLVQGRAWMLLLQPVLGRKERSPLALVHLAEAADRMRTLCPWLRIGIHPRRRGRWTPMAR